MVYRIANEFWPFIRFIGVKKANQAGNALVTEIKATLGAKLRLEISYRFRGINFTSLGKANTILEQLNAIVHNSQSLTNRCKFHGNSSVIHVLFIGRFRKKLYIETNAVGCS